jgi:imidazolonepropionase-like amidohydrolase
MRIEPLNEEDGLRMTGFTTARRGTGGLCLLLVLLFVPLSTGQANPQSAPPVTLVKADRLLDPRTGNVLTPAAVLIEGDKIKQVGSPSQAGASGAVKIIDVGRATLLPGLIDSHTHLFLDIIVPPEAELQRHANAAFAPGLLLAIVESPSKRAFVAAQLAR